MALTQNEWYLKLKSWLPTWWFEETGYNEAVLQGLAAVFAAVQENGEQHQQQTFITMSDTPFIDAHGDERGVDRLPAEPNGPYATRIQNLTSRTNVPSLKAAVDALLIKGESTFIEHGDWAEGHPYFNREAFYNRRELFTDLSYNVFSIVVAKQLHDPYSFFNREYFANREDFVGSNESSQEIFDQIVASVNKSKVGGVMYRIVETTG